MEKLNNWLLEVNAQYPQADEEFDTAKFQNYITKIKNELWPKLERDRKNMLSEDFQPNADWWGSKVTKD